MSTNELSVLTLQLRALEGVELRQKHMGRATQEVFLALLPNAVADRLHPSNSSTLHPYTTSGYFAVNGLGPSSGRLLISDRIWIWFTALGADVDNALCSLFDKIQNGEIRALKIDKERDEASAHNWLVEYAMWNNPTWARWANFDQIQQFALVHTPPVVVTLDFRTWTQFKRAEGNQMVTSPEPDLVFKSLLQRWYTFSQSTHLFGLQQAQLERWIHVHIRLMEQKTQEGTFLYKERNVERGFRGRATYLIGESGVGWRREHDSQLRAIHALLQFAPYSGVGKKTTAGCGIVRWLG